MTCKKQDLTPDPCRALSAAPQTPYPQEPAAKTVEACSCAIRRLGEYFDQRIDALTEAQLLEYFSDLVESHSWSTVKLDLYGLTFYCEHVHKKPWLAPGLIKPPHSQCCPIS